MPETKFTKLTDLPRFDLEQNGSYETYGEMVEQSDLWRDTSYGGDWVRWEDVKSLLQNLEENHGA